MPKGGKKATPPPTQFEEASRQSSSPPLPSASMDVQALFRWMADREDAAQAEREEQRREDAARFKALLTRLAALTPQPKSQHSAKPKPQKSKKNGHATIHMVRTQSPSGVPRSPMRVA
ncbi:hypothetical protein E2C01_056298 [Portunus trituberculatus]|uniref:Uncharacterized protein n=1 Tax=Portunus trituberculatus TaxID=210409 RepID=A0A5B7GXP8_PORTR|nr:hypothetical protein [Portunus trituberculatus]